MGTDELDSAGDDQRTIAQDVVTKHQNPAMAGVNGALPGLMAVMASRSSSDADHGETSTSARPSSASTPRLGRKYWE